MAKMHPAQFVARLLEKAKAKAGREVESKTKPSQEQTDALNRLGISARQISLLHEEWRETIIWRFKDWLRDYKRCHNNSGPATGRSKTKLISLGYREEIPIDMSQTEISKIISEYIARNNPGDEQIEQMLESVPEGESNDTSYGFCRFVSGCVYCRHSNNSFLFVFPRGD